MKLTLREAISVLIRRLAALSTDDLPMLKDIKMERVDEALKLVTELLYARKAKKK